MSSDRSGIQWAYIVCLLLCIKQSMKLTVQKVDRLVYNGEEVNLDWLVKNILMGKGGFG